VIRRHWAALRVALMSVDMLSAIVVFVVIANLRSGPDDWTRVLASAPVAPWLVAAGCAAAWVGMLWLRGLYRLRTRWSLRREAADIIASALLLAVVTFAFLFLAKLNDVSRLFLLALFPTQAVATLLSRAVLRWAFAHSRARGHNASFILVVGAGPSAQAFADRLEAHTDLGLRVVGHLSEGASGEVVTRPILGRLEEIESVLHGRVVDEVAIALPMSSAALIEPIARLCEEEGKVVRIPLETSGPPLEGGIVEEFDGSHVLSLVYGPDRAVSLFLKRVLDVGIAAAALVVLTPLLLAIALWVRAVEGAPVLFRQQRVGLHGRPFTLLKFRTMIVGAEEQLAELSALNEIDGRAFKLSDDPRRTSTGRTLRRTSLDELPQLWNVLRGEMSLVGPRPPLPHEVEGYDVWHRRRLSMKPGITGLWQIEGRRESAFDRWVEMDLDYIDRWSIWLDLKILVRTVPAVFTLQGR
jgi:exopolysaccharide biosynthesis polyprenyl glycosylphosphotransferase